MGERHKVGDDDEVDGHDAAATDTLQGSTDEEDRESLGHGCYKSSREEERNRKHEEIPASEDV